MAEGVDFDHQYGRAVICIGVPFQYTESRILRARLEFLRENYGIRENDFLSFDGESVFSDSKKNAKAVSNVAHFILAMRHASQCLGRVIRGKDDYGIMILADKRFARKRNQLPKWINQNILESEVNLSTDMAVATAKNFLRTMAQPFKAKDHEGISSWTPAQLEEQIAKRKMEQDRIERGLEPVVPERNGGDNNNHNMNSAQVDKDEFDDDIDEELMMLDT